MVDIIVTRHPALKQYLINKGIASETTLVVDHVMEEDIRGKNVAGILPLHLASVANSIITVELVVPLEMRGKELSLEDMENFCNGLRKFSVQSLPLD